MADIPVNEYRLLEIERLLALVPAPQMVSELLVLGTNVSTLVLDHEKLKRDVEHYARESKDAAHAFDSFHLGYLIRLNRLTRHIHAYKEDQTAYQDPWWLRVHGFKEDE